MKTVGWSLSWLKHPEHLPGIAKFCAEEILRQHDDPETVADLMRAWLQAIKDKQAGAALNVETIVEIHRLAKPDMSGFRVHGVSIGTHVAPDWKDVPRLMNDWEQRLHRVSTIWTGRGREGIGPDSAEAYRQFEEIHPFADGNGRVGKIIFNWLNDTLETPEMPPDFWGHDNP